MVSVEGGEKVLQQFKGMWRVRGWKVDGGRWRWKGGRKVAGGESRGQEGAADTN